MFTFFSSGGFKQIDPKEYDSNKYTSNSSERCFLRGYLEYTNELRELHNDYPLAQDKIEIKREMLSNYQLKIANLYNISIDHVIKLVSKIFNKRKYVLHYEKLKLYLQLGLKIKKKKNTSPIRI